MSKLVKIGGKDLVHVRASFNFDVAGGKYFTKKGNKIIRNTGQNWSWKTLVGK